MYPEINILYLNDTVIGIYQSKKECTQEMHKLMKALSSTFASNRFHITTLVYNYTKASSNKKNPYEEVFLTKGKTYECPNKWDDLK